MNAPRLPLTAAKPGTVPGLALEVPAQRGAFPFVDRICAILQGRARPLGFADLPALAAYMHRERAGRGLLLKDAVASYDGSDTFKAVTVCWLGPDGDVATRSYAFTVYLQGRPREALEAALAAANPDVPEAA